MGATPADGTTLTRTLLRLLPRRTWPGLGPVRLVFAGLASRRCASTARDELVLAAESVVNLAASCCRGSPALDRAAGRDATVPTAGCRIAGGALAADVLLRLRSWHGPPIQPRGCGWRAPTRSLSETRLAPGAASGGPVEAGVGCSFLPGGRSPTLFLPAAVPLLIRGAATHLAPMPMTLAAEERLARGRAFSRSSTRPRLLGTSASLGVDREPTLHDAAATWRLTHHESAATCRSE